MAAAKDVLGSMDPATIDDPGLDAEARRRGWGDALWTATRPQFVSEGITIDQRYRSDVIQADADQVTPWESTEYTWSSKPGHRAPHAWMPASAARVSTRAAGPTLHTVSGPRSARSI